MKILTVCGITKSGKTTTAEHLIRELTGRGYTVGSLKDIHFEEFAIDEPGTNTHRHRLAGADPVTARGLFETDVLFGRQLTLEEMMPFYHQDYLVLEGWELPGIPMILTAHGVGELEERDNPFVFAVCGRISADMVEYKGRPVIDATADIKKLVDLVEQRVYDHLPMVSRECCGLCGMDCAALGARILEGTAQLSACRLRRQVSLQINGQEIKMVPFVQQLLKNAVLGVARELNGYQKGQIRVTFYDE